MNPAYVAAEAPKSVERRLWAWKRHHGVERLPVLVVRSSVNLLNGDADFLLALLQEVRATHGRIALVVIDTLARAMVGDENTGRDMGAFIAVCGCIKEECEAHVLIVHHTGKDEARGARGWSGLRCAIDAEIEVTKDAAGGSIRVSKTRDESEGGQTFRFHLERVELGRNAKGRMVTTCVALEADAPAGKDKGRKLGPNERVVFDALAAAVADRADAPPLAPDIPRNAKGATVERWQEHALRYLPQDEPRRKRRAFDRAVSSLVASQAVRHAGGFAWLP